MYRAPVKCMSSSCPCLIDACAWCWNFLTFCLFLLFISFAIYVHFSWIWLRILYRCATGEAWQDIMTACYVNKPCDPLTGKIGDECGSKLSYVYFTSFVFLSTFLVSDFSKEVQWINELRILKVLFVQLHRCSTCSSQLSWTISIISLKIRVFWVLIIWTNSYVLGQNMIHRQGSVFHTVCLSKTTVCIWMFQWHDSSQRNVRNAKEYSAACGFRQKLPVSLSLQGTLAFAIQSYLIPVACCWAVCNSTGVFGIQKIRNLLKLLNSSNVKLKR